MNKFVRHNSHLFISITWIFIIALFIDGSNATDIISDVVTLHSDDDYASTALIANTSNTSADRLNQEPLSSSTHSPQKRSSKNPTAPPRVVYDEDSPSLVGSTFVSDFSSSLMIDHKQFNLTFDLHSELLYLRYCQLLI